MKTKFLLPFLVLLIGCTNSVLDEQLSVCSGSSNCTYSMSVEEALKELDNFNESVYDYSVVKSRNQIADIFTCSVPMTKSEDSDDVLAYLVNYHDNAGFAVISADPLVSSIVARGEYGNLDYEKLNNKIDECLSDIRTKSMDMPVDTIPGESPEDFVYTIIANTLAASSRAGRDTISVTYGDWEYNTKYGPYVTVKWNQTYPFNMCMPTQTDWLTKSYEFYRGLPPVGCANIAVAQILATIQQPSLAPGTNVNYSWTTLKSLSNYSNLSNYLPGLTVYPFDSNPTLMSKVEDLADFLYKISSLNQSTIDANGTGSNIDKVRSTLKTLNPSYFINAAIRNFDSNSDILTSCIHEGKPIYCRGSRYSNGAYVGHAWVIDGHASRTRKITTITLGPNNETQTWNRYQTSEFYHVNWGYSGQYDGYYHIGNFDMTEREGWDEQIDTYPSTNNGTRNYDYAIKFLSY